jgi:hypothetical protein
MRRAARVIVIVVPLSLLSPVAGPVLTGSAQARTVCGTVPAVGVVYRVARANLELHLTAHFQDAAGDHQEATLTATYSSSHWPGAGTLDGALFNGCPGKPPVWSATTKFAPLTYSVSAAWQKASVEPGEPASGSCAGSYRASAGLEAAWHFPLTSAESEQFVRQRSPKVAFGQYVESERGSCKMEEIEVLEDAVKGALDKRFVSMVHVPRQTLWHEGPRFALPISESYVGPVQLEGIYSGSPGAVTSVDLKWRGSVSFARAYTCQPNGCRLVGPGED